MTDKNQVLVWHKVLSKDDLKEGNCCWFCLASRRVLNRSRATDD